MGKAGRASLDDIKVKVKRGAASPCGPELVGYLGCLDGNSGSDTRCAGIRAALERCMATAPARPRKQHKPPLNYFLQQVGPPAARPRAPALGFSLRPAERPPRPNHSSSSPSRGDERAGPARRRRPLGTLRRTSCAAGAPVPRQTLLSHVENASRQCLNSRVQGG